MHCTARAEQQLDKELQASFATADLLFSCRRIVGRAAMRDDETDYHARHRQPCAEFIHWCLVWRVLVAQQGEFIGPATFQLLVIVTSLAEPSTTIRPLVRSQHMHKGGSSRPTAARLISITKIVAVPSGDR